MKNLQKIILLILVIFISCENKNTQNEETTETITTEIKINNEPDEEELEYTLRKNLPDWVFQSNIISKNKINDAYLIDLILKPFYLEEDFNGDGIKDIALPVKEISSGKVGFAIIHGKTNEIHIIGAGKEIKNGLSDDMDYIDTWEINREKMLALVKMKTEI